MNVVEIVTQKVREAVNVMSAQFPALIKGKLNEKADVSSVPTKVSDLTNDFGYQNAQQVEDKIDAKVSGVYRASDSASSVATLPALTKANVGRVSNMLNDFTTTVDFVEGAGKTFSAGTNVVVTDSVSGGYKYDVLAGFVDLSGKQDKLVVTGAANKGVYVSATGVVSPVTYELNANVPANFAPATAAPLMDGTAAVGTSAKYAHEDHRHPVDTSRASAADLSMLVNYIKSMDVSRVASGNPATFSDADAANIKDLRVTLTPTQSGSGDPYPPGGGKNLLEITADSATINGVTFTVDKAAGTVTVDGTNTSDVASSLVIAQPQGQRPNTYRLVSGNSDASTGSAYIFYRINGYGRNLTRDAFNITLADGDAGFTHLSVVVAAGATVSNMVFRPMLYESSNGVDDAFAPYSNIRPISGVSSVTVTRTGENGANPQTVSVTLTDGSNPLTVYGGTLDVTTGTLTVTYGVIDLGALNYTTTSYDGMLVFKADNQVSGMKSEAASFCEIYKRGQLYGDFCIMVGNTWYGNRPVTIKDSRFTDPADLKAALNGVKCVYELATPATYHLTPQQLTTLHGYNAVSSDAGNVDVTYKADASIVLGGGA